MLGMALVILTLTVISYCRGAQLICSTTHMAFLQGSSPSIFCGPRHWCWCEVLKSQIVTINVATLAMLLVFSLIRLVVACARSGRPHTTTHTHHQGISSCSMRA
jgi:hypothetical protein